MKKNIILILIFFNSGNLLSQSSDTLKMYYSEIDNFLSMSAGTFQQFKYRDSYGSAILSYTNKFLNDTSWRKRKQAVYAIIRIGGISKNQEIRTKALNGYLEVLDYPEIPMDGLFIFEKKDYDDYSKRLLIKLFTRNASDQDIKMRELYYWNSNRDMFIKSIRDSKISETENAGSMDSVIFKEYREQIKNSVHYWKNKEPINTNIIYTIGLLDMKDFANLLEEKIGDKRYNQDALRLALARLGNTKIEEYFEDSIKNIINGNIVFANILYQPIKKLQYICTYKSIECIVSILKSNQQFYPDYADRNCKKVPVSFLALMPLSQSLLSFPLKPDPDLEPWCETMNNVKVLEYISLAKDWVSKNSGRYPLNRDFKVYPK